MGDGRCPSCLRPFDAPVTEEDRARIEANEAHQRRWVEGRAPPGALRWSSLVPILFATFMMAALSAATRSGPASLLALFEPLSDPFKRVSFDVLWCLVLGISVTAASAQARFERALALLLAYLFATAVPIILCVWTRFGE